MLRAYIYVALALTIILVWSNAKANHVDLSLAKVLQAVDCFGNTIDVTIWDAEGVIVGYHDGEPNQFWFEEFKRAMNHDRDFEVMFMRKVECE